MCCSPPLISLGSCWLPAPLCLPLPHLYPHTPQLPYPHTSLLLLPRSSAPLPHLKSLLPLRPSPSASPMSRSLSTSTPVPKPGASTSSPRFTTGRLTRVIINISLSC